jgi:hypothetical protein
MRFFGFSDKDDQIILIGRMYFSEKCLVENKRENKLKTYI